VKEEQMAREIIELLKRADEIQRTPEQQEPGETEGDFVDRVHRQQLEEDAWVGALRYQGNSVSWTCSKAKNYGDSLLKVWEALQAIGVPCDGNTHAADAIRKFCMVNKTGLTS
jgi:hypothetical protein